MSSGKIAEGAQRFEVVVPQGNLALPILSEYLRTTLRWETEETGWHEGGKATQDEVLYIENDITIVEAAAIQYVINHFKAKKTVKPEDVRNLIETDVQLSVLRKRKKRKLKKNRSAQKRKRT